MSDRKLVAVPADQYTRVIQELQDFLNWDDLIIPGRHVEAIVSAKSMCRALLSGQMVLANQAPENPPKPPKDIPPPVDAPEDDADE